MKRIVLTLSAALLAGAALSGCTSAGADSPQRETTSMQTPFVVGGTPSGCGTAASSGAASAPAPSSSGTAGTSGPSASASSTERAEPLDEAFTDAHLGDRFLADRAVLGAQAQDPEARGRVLVLVHVQIAAGTEGDHVIRAQDFSFTTSTGGVITQATGSADLSSWMSSRGYVPLADVSRGGAGSGWIVGWASPADVAGAGLVYTRPDVVVGTDPDNGRAYPKKTWSVDL